MNIEKKISSNNYWTLKRSYETGGLPALPPEIMGTSLEVNWGHQVDEQILTLEKSWKNRVEFPDDLPKIEKVAQEAIWEIIYTVEARKRQNFDSI